MLEVGAGFSLLLGQGNQKLSSYSQLYVAFTIFGATFRAFHILINKIIPFADLMEQPEQSLKGEGRDFPGGPVVRTLHLGCRGCKFHPWSRN